MENQWIEISAKELNLSFAQVKTVFGLLSDGNTIPFIARYRKEKTGGLDEVMVMKLEDLLNRYEDIHKKKKKLLAAIEATGTLTTVLRDHIGKIWDETELDDLYLPYKREKKTRADVAIAAGLKPLAEIILKQREYDIYHRANDFVKGEIRNAADALQGARDIIAERIHLDVQTRNIIRELFLKEAVIYSKVKKGKAEAAQKYKDYHAFQEAAGRMSAHRFLALMRGEKEGLLKIYIAPESEKVLFRLEKRHIEKYNSCGQQIKLAVADAWERLLQPSMETELKQVLKAKADEESIHVFALNLKQLLLGAPLGHKRVLAIDPGIRTGCKVAMLDEQGKLLKTGVVFPQQQTSSAEAEMLNWYQKYAIEAIAVGNGTAGRETEQWLRKLKWPQPVPEIFSVNEDGASIYSASEIARREFPHLDLSYRGAVSIGRRLMDPLSELVKIDPKSIGVGQYQHDVNQNRLKEQLDRTILSCVNFVGVNLNTASEDLLRHVSGLGPVLAANIVQFRNENGKFKLREDLMKVPRMGGKSFEQSAGFLRIPDSPNPLDRTAVHPERYALVKKMAQSMGTDLENLLAQRNLIENIGPDNFVSEECGRSTIEEILEELAKPARDPRKTMQSFSFDDRIKSPSDLVVGMRIPGLVTNLTNFGAFVDIGVKQDGLIHVSQITDRFIQSPAEVLSIGQQVWVRISEVDLLRKRIGLSMKEV